MSSRRGESVPCECSNKPVATTNGNGGQEDHECRCQSPRRPSGSSLHMDESNESDSESVVSLSSKGRKVPPTASAAEIKQRFEKYKKEKEADRKGVELDGLPKKRKKKGSSPPPPREPIYTVRFCVLARSSSTWSRKNLTDFFVAVPFSTSLDSLMKKGISASSYQDEMTMMAFDDLRVNGTRHPQKKYRSMSDFKGVVESTSLKKFLEISKIAKNKVTFYLVKDSQSTDNDGIDASANQPGIPEGSGPAEEPRDEQAATMQGMDPPSGNTAAARAPDVNEPLAEPENEVGIEMDHGQLDYPFDDNDTLMGDHMTLMMEIGREGNLSDEDLLLRWREITRDASSRELITVDRDTFMESLKENIDDEFRNFSFLKAPKVTFLEDTADDQGGLTRELFALVLQHLEATSGVFVKVGDKRLLSCDYPLLEHGAYKEAGKMIAGTILHEHQGFTVLAEETISLLLDEQPSLIGLIPSIHDTNVKSAIMSLCQAEEDTWEKVLDSVGPFLRDQGFPKAEIWKIEDKKSHINSVLRAYFRHRAGATYEQFKEGLESIGHLWTFLSTHRSLLDKLLSYRPFELTAASFSSFLEFKFAAPNSNAMKRQKKTARLFNQYLPCLEKGMKIKDAFEVEQVVTLQTLLQVITGYSRVPPLGIKGKIQVEWFTQGNDKNTRYPDIKTCGMVIFLPEGWAKAKPAFYRYLNEALVACRDTFGKV